MKKSIILLAAICACTIAQAGVLVKHNSDTIINQKSKVLIIKASKDTLQQIKNAIDTISVTVEQGKVVVVERNEDGSRTEIVTTKTGGRTSKSVNLEIAVAVDLGYNAYDSHNLISGSGGGDDFLSLNTGKSFNLGVYPLMTRVNLLRHSNALQLRTGLGVDWGNYRFEDSWTIANQDGATIASDAYRLPDGTGTLSKSKLTTVYMNVPVILSAHFPASKEKNFYIGAGVIGGLKLGSHTKVKYEDGGGKHKQFDSYNLNMMRWDLTFRAGYDWLGVYFNCQMNPMFKKGHGPELYPYSAGLTIAMFQWKEKK